MSWRIKINLNCDTISFPLYSQWDEHVALLHAWLILWNVLLSQQVLKAYTRGVLRLSRYLVHHDWYHAILFSGQIKKPSQSGQIKKTKQSKPSQMSSSSIGLGIFQLPFRTFHLLRDTPIIWSFMCISYYLNFVLFKCVNYAGLHHTLWSSIELI